MKRSKISSAQEGLWFSQKLIPDAANNISGYFEINTEINQRKMAAALLHHHREAEALRVNFTEDEGVIYQELRDLESWQPDFFDVSGATIPEDAAKELISDITGQIFDLSSDALYRFGLIKLNESRFFLFFVAHHIVCDGLGGMVAVRRVLEIYETLNTSDAIPPTKYCRLDSVIEASATYENSESFASDEEFWSKYTTAWPEQPIKLGRQNPSESTTLRLRLSIDKSDSANFIAAANDAGVPLSSFFATTLMSCLNRASSLSNFSVRLAVANRMGVAWNTPCMLSNAVPVRVDLTSIREFSSFARFMNDEINLVRKHGRYPTSKVRPGLNSFAKQRNPFGPIINIMPFFGTPLKIADSQVSFLDASRA
ncbi:condensation domain-containing protein [Mycobacteroides abscessus]|uniref:condensation domain-containing protein n=1 Tax=Mycobacteroides abscessus TaxID=36809 RepID=UPI0009A8FAA7|nr:condensation domain-containing protein [Mycobacteroides abscessus]